VFTGLNYIKAAKLLVRREREREREGGRKKERRRERK